MIAAQMMRFLPKFTFQSSSRSVRPSLNPSNTKGPGEAKQSRARKPFSTVHFAKTLHSVRP